MLSRSVNPAFGLSHASSRIILRSSARGVDGWVVVAGYTDKSQQAWGAGDFARSRWLKWTRGLLSYVVMVFRWMAMVVCAQCLRSAS
uniref:Uncharacterized protein n=1 Tax=Oryza meridionalis TaxID=40149 RepID=A0A0E0CBT1_9ORYZ